MDVHQKKYAKISFDPSPVDDGHIAPQSLLHAVP